MDERHIRVTKTARYFSLGAPGPGVQQLWVVCHGYRQLAKRFLRRFHPLDDGTRLIVAPEGFSRFYLDDGTRQHGKDDPIGATWMTREDRDNEIRDYVAFLDRVLDETTRSLGGGPESLTVLGFSQGVHTVCRWVVAGDFEVARTVLWGGYPPPDLDPERGPARLAATDLVLVRGLTDRHVSEESHGRQEQRLDELGIPFRTLTHQGGHELDPDLLVKLSD
mgnify:FL=1